MRWITLSLFALLGGFVSLWVGASQLTFAQAALALFGQGEPAHILIMQELRLPRALLALCIGAGLGASGAALQGYTRNPLADPGILGFSACAALGAVAALYFGLRGWVVPFALTGAALGSALILMIAGPRKGANTLILAGVGIGALATAITGLVMNFASNPWALSEIVYWMMGSLREAGPDALKVCAALTALGLFALLWTGRDLNVLALGEETAMSLGVSLRRVQILLIVGVALCVGSGVAVAGAIGFIGLFVPHIIRQIFSPDPARLIPLSALGGAGFLAFADTATRLISVNGAVLYLGVLTSLIGVPFFLYLAMKGGAHDTL